MVKPSTPRVAAALVAAIRPSARAATLAISLLAAANMAYAQGGTTAHRVFQVPSGSLATALAGFAADSGANVSAPPELVRGKTSQGLQGRYTVGEGLRLLLAGTGLEAVVGADGGYVLRTTPAPAGKEATLPSITVSGKAPGSTTEGTGSYTTWSTSSSTRLNLTPQETPQAVTMLTRQRMDDQKLDTLVDALDATAGIIVQHTTHGQDGPDVYARGQSLRNYQIDGVPVFYAMSPFLANTAAFDRIEVVRGATGIMNGLGTPAATVNMVRKRPTAEPQVTLTAQAGSWNRHGAGIDASGALNEDKSLRGRFVADYTHQNAWVDRYKQKGLALYGVGELDLGPDTLLTAGFSHLRQNNDSAIVGRPLYFNDGTRTPLTPADNTSQPWRYYDHETTSAFASLEHRFAPGWVGKVEYTHTRYHYDGMVGSFWTADDASGNGSRTYASHWDSKPRQDNLDAYVTGAFPLFGRDHELIAGVTLSRVRAAGPSYIRDPNYNIFVNYYDWADLPEPVFIQTGSNYQRQRQANAFLSTRLSMTDATSVLLGGRLTRWRMDNSDSTGYEYHQKENVFVPYAGIVHALDDTWSVYGSYTKIFRPQDDYVIEFNEAPADPEDGTGYEAGVKASFYEGRLTASLALFQTKLKNLAVWNNDSYFYDILGETKTRGVELELNGELAKNWNLTAGYALAHSENENGDRVLTYVPRQSLKLFTTYRLPGTWNKLTLGGGATWQSESNSGLDINHHQGSVTLVNLMARYEVDKHLSVALHVNNALNKRYFSSIASNAGIYGAPRNFMVALKYRL